MDVLVSLITLIAPFVIIWVILGYLAKLTKNAETVTDGMNKVLNGIIMFFKADSSKPPQNIIYNIDDSQLQLLTDRLSPHFAYLILNSATQGNDLFEVIYCAGVCKVPITVVETIFRKFLQQKLNLHSTAPVNIYVDNAEGCLTLLYALSGKGYEIVQTNKNNRRSREINSHPIKEDIEE